MWSLLAQTTPAPAPVSWHPDSFPMALAMSAAFGLVGIVLAVFGFKLFAWLTPGDLQDEIFKKGNIAAAILAAAVIIGICIVIAAAVG
jgi:uncharacterized membrane protein YjfL (UPF0719 family)